MRGLSQNLSFAMLIFLSTAAVFAQAPAGSPPLAAEQEPQETPELAK